MLHKNWWFFAFLPVNIFLYMFEIKQPTSKRIGNGKNGTTDYLKIQMINGSYLLLDKTNVYKSGRYAHDGI